MTDARARVLLFLVETTLFPSLSTPSVMCGSAVLEFIAIYLGSNLGSSALSQESFVMVSSDTSLDIFNA